MKRKNRDYFWIPFTVAMLFGLILGATNELLHAWPTADWASKGQPFFDRWINRQFWFLYGFVPGALIGAIVGFFGIEFRLKIMRKVISNKSLKSGTPQSGAP